MPEITDAEYRQLLAARGLLANLVQNPKSKHKTEAAIKDLVPSFQTEADKAQPILGHVGRLEKKLDAFLTNYENGKIDGELSASFDRLKKSGYTDDGVTEIKRLMVDRKIPDAEAAAALFDRLHPPQSQAPTSFQPSGWNWGKGTEGNADLTLLFKDEDAWADQEAAKAWTESKNAV